MFQTGNYTLDFTGTNLKGFNHRGDTLDWSPSINDVMTCVCQDGTVWSCLVSPRETNEPSTPPSSTDTGSNVSIDAEDGDVIMMDATSSATLDAINNGYKGQVIHVVFRTANYTVDFTGTGLKGNGAADWTPGVNDAMTCIYLGSGTWSCIISPTGE